MIIDSITEKHKTMGIVEVIREREKKAIHDAGIEAGIEKGIEKGMKKGAEGKSLEFVKKMLLSDRFTVAEIVDLADVTEAFVNKVKKNMK